MNLNSLSYVSDYLFTFHNPFLTNIFKLQEFRLAQAACIDSGARAFEMSWALAWLFIESHCDLSQFAIRCIQSKLQISSKFDRSEVRRWVRNIRDCSVSFVLKGRVNREICGRARSCWERYLAHDLVPWNVTLLLHRGLDVVAEVDGPELRILHRVLFIGEAYVYSNFFLTVG